MGWERILELVLPASQGQEGHRHSTPMVVRPVWFQWTLCKSFESKHRVSPPSTAARPVARSVSQPARVQANFTEMYLITSGIRAWMRMTGLRTRQDCHGLLSTRTILAVSSADQYSQIRYSFSFPMMVFS